MPQRQSRIALTPDRRARLLRVLKQHFTAEFDEPLSEFRAEGLLDLFVRELGPPIYNQGVNDAARFMQERLSDIDGEIHEPESR